MKRTLAGLGVALLLALAPATSALAGPGAVFIDDDNNCTDPSRQVSSLPPSDGTLHFYVWLNAAQGLSNGGSGYSMALVPLFQGGTTLVGSQPVSFSACPSSTWAWAEVGYGGFVPGKYAWLVYDPAGNLVGSDTVYYQ